MKLSRLLQTAFAVLMLLPLGVVAQEISVTPLSWDYGSVEVGSSASMNFSVENIDYATILQIGVVLIVDESSTTPPYASDAYEITGYIPEGTPFPGDILPGETVEIVVTFTPIIEGTAVGSLYISSNDNPPPGALVKVQLLGLGVVVEPPPSELMEEIVDFFFEGVTAGTISGVGNGNSSAAHLRVFSGILDSADDLATAGDIEGACARLAHAADKSDGEPPPPPDFIAGTDVPLLYGMILNVMDVLGCN